MTTLRPLFAQLGAIERSDGSAQISHGRTAAMAGVFGPGDVRAAKVGLLILYIKLRLVYKGQREIGVVLAVTFPPKIS